MGLVSLRSDMRPYLLCKPKLGSCDLTGCTSLQVHCSVFPNVGDLWSQENGRILEQAGLIRVRDRDCWPGARQGWAVVLVG